jgi:hypothetical protein
MSTMTAAELDTVYTRLCQTMTQLGESNASLFLARFALLAIDRIGDADAAQQLVAAAAEDIAPPADGLTPGGLAS